MHDAESSLDYQGTYTGVFPAADCPGIDMRLTLKKDGTYSLHMKYLNATRNSTRRAPTR